MSNSLTLRTVNRMNPSPPISISQSEAGAVAFFCDVDELLLEAVTLVSTLQ